LNLAGLHWKFSVKAGSIKHQCLKSLKATWYY